MNFINDCLSYLTSKKKYHLTNANKVKKTNTALSDTSVRIADSCDKYIYDILSGVAFDGEKVVNDNIFNEISFCISSIDSFIGQIEFLNDALLYDDDYDLNNKGKSLMFNNKPIEPEDLDGIKSALADISTLSQATIEGWNEIPFSKKQTLITDFFNERTRYYNNKLEELDRCDFLDIFVE